MNIKYTSKRFFSVTPVLRAGDDNDILSRINTLLIKRKSIVSAMEDNKLEREKYAKALQENEDFQKKLFSEENKLKEHISHGSSCLNKEEQKKVYENNNELSPIQVLVKNKLDNLDENNPSYTLDLIKLQVLYNRSVIKKLEYTDSVVDSAVMREQSLGNFPGFNLDYYLAVRAKILKDLFDFKKEESLYSSKNKELLTSLSKEESVYISKYKQLEESTAKKETPTEYIADKMAEEMPGYTDPED